MLNKLAEKLKMTKKELKERLNVSDDVSESQLLLALGFDKMAAYNDLLNYTKNLVGSEQIDLNNLNANSFDGIFEKIQEDIVNDPRASDDVRKMAEFMEKLQSMYGDAIFNHDYGAESDDEKEDKPISASKDKKNLS
ncbi:hypothetical protein HFMG06CAA_3453 [Mycoplasmoides gallisepticum CA06_2006.052-5-2P]|uniref:Uncharacterized protein n=1 Tax=Mycoplasmoides gallisepticum WI01_2001.043-13-2P TaxID=1159201 RepID=J3TR89_MYCGL|nr:hypothetical protein [Mycoplasmoides gallisepticum]AFP76010.1 hypothetical protein HFMG94VAA_3403 [Mycoplasmoides gallisepticum VA94_7994-1-7P]AFP76777.1 hypothetical protein HFMG95NCA_3330 [Mycoplasmoides gallisepticum NC95_13295-2-2P]AFP77531.1 hypothetical protein HFMG96NCA_3500 [Mycoplasmoides gallisepticum NC96_1596-4-2P]AFP78302.1 hypothetical protein HFMG01NYA_3392 [Mycoplasmoides gallisepticum NY01_2001.047-5-1P]AFP79062.1 hypothetical protein HFMG01WIA_3252 [Mycoplasmoides gallisep